MTAINYVRNLAGGGAIAAHVPRSPRAPQPGLPVSPVPRPGPAVPPVPFLLVAVGVLLHKELADRVSPACRISNVAIPPVWWR